MTPHDRKREDPDREDAPDVGGSSAVVNREGAVLELVIAQLREELAASNRERAALEARLREAEQRDAEDHQRASDAQRRAAQAQARAADAEARAAEARRRATLAEHELAVLRRDVQRTSARPAAADAAIRVYATRTRAWAHALARAAEMQRNATATLEEVVFAMRRSPALEGGDDDEATPIPPSSAPTPSSSEGPRTPERQTARPLVSRFPARTPPTRSSPPKDEDPAK